MAPVFPRFALLTLVLCALVFVSTDAQEDWVIPGGNPGDTPDGNQDDPWDPATSLLPATLDNLNQRQPCNDASELKLLTSDSFLWASNASDSAASPFTFLNMTAYASENSRVVSVERFTPLLDSVECEKQIRLTFKSDKVFERAQSEWSWLSKAENRSLVLVTNNAGCGPENERQPYRVTAATYDKPKKTVLLDGLATPWNQSFSDIDFQFGQGELGDGIQKRDFTWSKGFDMDLTTNHAGIFHEDELVRLQCVDCGLKGKLRVLFTARIGGGGLQEASMQITPDNLHLAGGMEFETKRGMPGPDKKLPYEISRSKTHQDFKLPWPKIKALGIISIRARIKRGSSFSIKKIRGEPALAKFGVDLRVPSDSTVYSDFASEGKDRASGWLPTPVARKTTISGKVGGNIAYALTWGVVAGIEILGAKVEAGVELKAPDVTFSVDGYQTPGTSCPKQNKEGTSVGMNFVSSASFKAGYSGQSDWKVTYPVTSEPIWGGSSKRDIAGAVETIEPRQHLSKRKPFVGGEIKVPLWESKLDTLFEFCIPPEETLPPPPRPEKPVLPRPLKTYECFADGQIGIVQPACPLGTYFATPVQDGKNLDKINNVCCVSYYPKLRELEAPYCYGYRYPSFEAPSGYGRCLDPTKWDCAGGEYGVERRDHQTLYPCTGNTACCWADLVYHPIPPEHKGDIEGH